MSRFCFVTFEFHPVTPGGCGVFIYNASIALLEAGHSVHLLIDIDDSSMQRLQSHPLAAAYPEKLQFHQLSTCGAPCHPSTAFRSVFEWSSHRFNEGAKQLDRQFRFDFIEWFDYCGIAYYATREKMAGTAYRNSLLAVRLHSTLEVMDANDGTVALDAGRFIAYAMEHTAIADCDLLLSNGRNCFDMGFSKFYPATAKHIVHFPPPLFDFPETPPENAVETCTGGPVVFLFYGRLYALKGADLLIEAGLQVLDKRPDLPLEFHFVGYDSNQPPTGSGTYQSYLESKIPDRHRDKFAFHGQRRWHELGEMLARTSCAVFPCYFDSFCYAAHELDACRIPLLLSRIPTFLEFFPDREEIRFFDLTVVSLATAIAEFAETPRKNPGRERPRGGFGRNLAPDYEASLGQWRAATGKGNTPSHIDLVVIRLGDKNFGTTRTSGIVADGATGVRILNVRPTAKVTANTVWFLGRLCEIYSDSGEAVAARSVRLGTHLLVCRSSDRISGKFLDTCLAAFRNNPDIGFAGTWLESADEAGQPVIDSFALDALHPVTPWFERDVLSRHVLRTVPGTLLADLFDYRLGKLGEAGYLQTLEDGGARGLTVPQALLAIRSGDNEQPSSIEVSHFLIRDTSVARARLRTAFQAAAWTQGLRSVSTEHRFSGNVLAILVKLANRLALMHDRFPMTRHLISRAHQAIQRKA